MPLIIPIHAIHQDEQYFYKPRDFLPERFEDDKFNELHLFSEDKVGLHPDADAGKFNV